MTVRLAGEPLPISVKVFRLKMEVISLYKEPDGTMIHGNWIGTGRIRISVN